MTARRNALWGRFRSFSNFTRSALSSMRSYAAVTSTGLSSVGNFLLSVSIARAGTVEEVAEFAIGFAGFLTISGVTRAMVSEPAAARLLDHKRLASAGRQVSLYGICLAVPLFLVGLIMDQLFLVAAGIFGHAIAMYDFSKFSSTVFGRPLVAILQELFKTMGVIVMLFIPGIATEPLGLFLAWLAITALVGYTGMIVQRIEVLPSYATAPVPARESLSYAMDYVLGGGTTQLTTFALGGLASPNVNASIRGAGTLLGPITMVATSIRALIIPFLSRKLRHSNDLSPATNVSMSLVLAALPLTLIINFMPSYFGETLLGDTWELTKTILPLLSIELMTTLLTQVPFAGHRSLGAHRRTLIIRSVLAPVRLLIIVPAGVLGGYVGAALAMVCTSLIGVVVWWISYKQLMKNAA